jgi:hypothetical protein
MDKYERMIIRSHVEWQAIRRAGGGRLSCPPCGETRPQGFELHHIAGARFGDETLPVCIICHRILSARQATEHPLILDAPPTQREKSGRFLIGLADIYELKSDRLREIGEQLIAEGQRSSTLFQG